MLKLIIVDDEYLLRQLIRNIIDWKALDIEVVGEMASADLAMPNKRLLNRILLI